MLGLGLSLTKGGGVIAPDVHVFLLAGQSNMVGRPTFDDGEGYPSGTLQYPKATGYNTYTDTTTIAASPPLGHWDADSGDMGLAINFAIDYVAANDNVQLVFIPAADGGTGFSTNEWNPGDAQYEHAVDATNALMAANPDWEFKGILWHQGERDYANSSFDDQFYLMIQSMREDINEADQETPFILGELLVGGDRTSVLNSGVLTDTPTYNYRTALVSSASLTGLADNLHFDASSLRTFGSRYEDAYTNLNNPYPTPESGATGHFIFGNSNQLFLDLTSNNSTLQIQNSGGSAYSYDLGDTTVAGPTAASVTRGLLSNIDDTSNFTMCMVFKYEGASVGTILNGNLGVAGSTTAGHSWFVSPANDLRFNERGGVGAQTLRTSAQLTVGKYYFIASSLDSSDNYVLMIADSGETDGSHELTGTGSGRSTSTRKIGVGNAHYESASFSGNTVVSEMIFFDTAKTLTELRAIANRSRTRLAARGITVE